jgi:hypothetical protein
VSKSNPLMGLVPDILNLIEAQFEHDGKFKSLDKIIKNKVDKKFIKIVTNDHDVIEDIMHQNKFDNGKINIFNGDYICVNWNLQPEGAFTTVLIKEVDV